LFTFVKSKFPIKIYPLPLWERVRVRGDVRSNINERLNYYLLFIGKMILFLNV